MNVRELALNAYQKIMDDKAYSNIVINDMLRKEEIPDADKGLFTELVYGTLSYKLTLDFYAQPFLKTRLKRWQRHLIHMSLYQLIHLDRVPDHAVINDAVEIAKTRGGRQSANAVNAILRNVTRTELRNVDELNDDLKRLSVECSMPVWILKQWQTHHGIKETKRIAAALLERPDLYIRVNTRHITPARLITLLSEEGYVVERTPLHEDALLVTGGADIVGSKSYEEGLFSIQDVSSMLAARALGVNDGDAVLDACSAPGGKGLYALEKNAAGHVDLTDIYDHKITVMDLQAKRLKLDNYDAYRADATGYEYGRMYDKIIVDAPCSGLGVVRRKPEIKYARREVDIDSFVNLQLDILNHVKNYLKPGGTLVYSTCTIHQMENENVAYTFKKANDDFDFSDFHIDALDFTGPYRQILPHEMGTDGFFIARFKKKEV